MAWQIYATQGPSFFHSQQPSYFPNRSFFREKQRMEIIAAISDVVSSHTPSSLAEVWKRPSKQSINTAKTHRWTKRKIFMLNVASKCQLRLLSEQYWWRVISLASKNCFKKKVFSLTSYIQDCLPRYSFCLEPDWRWIWNLSFPDPDKYVLVVADEWYKNVPLSPKKTLLPLQKKHCCP